MRRKLSISVLFVLGLCAVTAVGQPPPFSPPLPGQPAPKQPAPKEKKADLTDVSVAAALANDPDVRIANARVQLAEAEVAKAKQAVVFKVLTLKASINEYKAAVNIARSRLARLEKLYSQNAIDQSLLLEERAKLETAQAALARAETELKLLTGDRLTAEADRIDLTVVEAARKMEADTVRRHQMTAFLALMQAASAHETIKGPIPDRIRAALDKPVKLGAKGEQITFAKALEIFKKEAGFDVPVRDLAAVLPVRSEGEELPVGAWLQLFADGSVDVRFLVREYGLLVTQKDAAPPDAVTVLELWKQRPVAAAKKETLPEPKPK